MCVCVCVEELERFCEEMNEMDYYGQSVEKEGNETWDFAGNIIFD